MRTLQDLLDEIRRGGSREAIRWSNGFRVTISSYAELYRSIGAVVGYFKDNDIRAGDRILLWAENRMEWVAVFWACVASGVVAVPADFRFSESLVRRIESESNAKLTIDSTILDTIARLHGSSAFPIKPANPDDIVEIVYTSGTTGEPKGIIHRHRHISANLRPFQSEINKYKKFAWPLQPIRVLNLLPLSHMFGQALGIYVPLLLKGSAIFTPEIHPARIVQMIRDHRVTAVVTVPQILESFRHVVERRFKIPRESPSVLLRLWRSRAIHSAFGWKFWAFVAGGAPVDPAVEEFWARVGFVVVQGYGLTEASPIVTVNHPFDARRGSLGKVLPGLEVKIASDGEILVRGESITLNDGSWLHTGDLGQMDAEGRLYYRGRKTDVIVTPDGLNVYPEDVERVLNRMPEVRRSTVVGVRRNGAEQVHAVVILYDPKADVEEVIKTANAHLEAHQRIKSWSVWPESEFPQTSSTMKVKRTEVARRISGPQLDLAEREPRPDLSAMSSLERVELLSELQDKFQMDLNEDEFANLKSLADLEEWLRKAARNPETTPANPRTRQPSRWARAFPVRLVRNAFQQLIAIPLFRHYLPLTVVGRDHLDSVKPPVIFAANHTSHLDAPAVFAALPFRWRRRVAPAMGIDLFRPYFEPEAYHPREIWRAGIAYVLACGLFNAYPLPQDVAGVRRALEYTGELVKRGYCPLVFPEGIRSPEGDLHSFRPGIGLMALRLGVPVIPVYLDGLYAIYSVHDNWPKRGRVRVSFGQPLRFSTETAEQVAVQLHDTVQKLRSNST